MYNADLTSLMNAMAAMMVMGMGTRIMTQEITVPYHPRVDLLNKAIADEFEGILFYDELIRRARELGDVEAVRVVQYIQSQEQSHYNALVRRLQEIRVLLQKWPATVHDVEEAVKRYHASMVDTAQTLGKILENYRAAIPRAVENYRISLMKRIE
jgi:ferritin-like protein